MTSFTMEELERVRDKHEPWLTSRQGVVGTGIGIDNAGQLSLKVYSNQMSAATRNEIRTRLGAYPVTIEETGEIRKQTS